MTFKGIKRRFDKMLPYARLGRSAKARLALAIFGLLVPDTEWSQESWRPPMTALVPRMWLSPKQLNGLSLLINPHDWSQTLIFDEIFINSGYDLNRVTFVPDLIFDCGAHIGLFSLLAKGRFPNSRLIAYEPNPNNIELIRQQIRGNGLTLEVVEAAVSTEETKRLFHANNSLSGKLLDVGGSCGFKVDVIDFPKAFQRESPASVLLKMDIEGEERALLPPLMALLPRKSALFFETHAGELGWREIELLLLDHGFHVEQINSRERYFDGFAIRE